MKKVENIIPRYVINIGKVNSIEDLETKISRMSVPAKPVRDFFGNIVCYKPRNKIIIKLGCSLETYTKIIENNTLSWAHYDGYYADCIMCFKKVNGFECVERYSAIGFICSVDGKTIKINC